MARNGGGGGNRRSKAEGGSSMSGPMDLLKEVIGESPAIEAVRSQIRRLLRRGAGTRHFPPILIQGETGTGKGLVARLIHRLGPRAGGPFVDTSTARRFPTTCSRPTSSASSAG